MLIKHRWFQSFVLLIIFLIFFFQDGNAGSSKINTNPTGCTSNPVLTSNQWQNISNQPTFNWTGATGTIEGYFVYFGPSSSGTDITAFTTEPFFQPSEGVITGSYFLRINTKDTGEEPPDMDWTTLFILNYDNSPPSSSAIESGGALDEIWQNSVTSPSFSISLPDLGVGTDGYYLYFGNDSSGTSPDPIIQGTFVYSPGSLADGEYYLRVNSVDLLGNTSGWQTIFTFRLDTLNPATVTSVTESNGLLSSNWGNINPPSFTWETPLGAAKYNIMWGPDPLSTVSTNSNVEPPFSASATLGKDNYLRIQSVDSAGNLSAWSNVLFTYWYDNSPPTDVTSVTEVDNGISSGQCSIIKNGTFAWDLSSTTGAPIAGYYYYWGNDPMGDTPHSSISGPPLMLSLPKGDKYFLRMAAYDVAGNISTWITNFILCNGDVVRLVTAAGGGNLNLGVPNSVVDATITFPLNGYQVFEDPLWVGKDFWARLWYPTINGHRDPSAGKAAPFNHQSFNLAADLASDSSTLFSLTLPLSVSLTYSEESILAIYENSLAIYRWNGDKWKILSNSTLDMVNNIVTGTTTHLGEYVLLGDPIPSSDLLSINVNSISFGSFVLTGKKQLLEGNTIPWEILDATYNNSGWQVLIHATEFIDAEGHTIPFQNLSMELPQANVITIIGNNSPESAMSSRNELSNDDQLMISSARGASSGKFSIRPQFFLTIPPDVYTGNYLNTVTVTIISGPS